VADRSGREVLEEWRGLMESAVSTAASAAGRPDLPRELLGTMQNQMALMQRLVERERLQGSELAARILVPLDAVFDLLEEGGATLRREAEALETAGRALQETAGLMKRQAELFEQTIGVLREPAELAKTAVGLDRRPRKSRAGEAGQRGATRPRSEPQPRSATAKRASPGAERASGADNRPGSAAKRSGATAKRQSGATKPRSTTTKRQPRDAKR
jgi:hypothetical protein